MWYMNIIKSFMGRIFIAACKLSQKKINLLLLIANGLNCYI